MIRIDEIYANVFNKFINNNIPNTRLFFCDPPGSTFPENLMNYGNDITEHNYVFLHDQEPIFLDIHKPLFDDVKTRNKDIIDNPHKINEILIHSEKNSESVASVCSNYGWRNYYYFFHGWAALDWFRGYNYSFLMPEPEDRFLTRSYISPNRIIGGKRDHRILFFYNTLKQNGTNNALISMPEICPYENKNIKDIAGRYQNIYPDISNTIESADLPWNFSGETGHPMESYRLGLFEQCSKSLAYIISETVFFGKRNHLTEKTFKPICLQMPFILLSTAFSLEYLRSYGFLTFSEFWDESYDEEKDDIKRIEKVSQLATEIDGLSANELNHMYKHMIPIIKHNYNHFYYGNFEEILWKELTNMLDKLKTDIKK